jgi:hypothetical protein
MLIALTDRYFADAGHALDFTNKAFESLDIIGWEHAQPCFQCRWADVGARGSEESNSWRQPIDLVPLCEGALAGLPEFVAGGGRSVGTVTVTQFLRSSCWPITRKQS